MIKVTNLLDSIVNHFNEMTRSFISDPIATGFFLTLRTYTLKNRNYRMINWTEFIKFIYSSSSAFRKSYLEYLFDKGPRGSVSTRHEWGTIPSSLLSTRDSWSHIKSSFFVQVLASMIWMIYDIYDDIWFALID